MVILRDRNPDVPMKPKKGLGSCKVLSAEGDLLVLPLGLFKRIIQVAILRKHLPQIREVLITERAIQ